MYYSAAPDFELMGFRPSDVRTTPYMPQSGVANSKIGSTDLAHNTICGSDPFLSVKQLLTISTLVSSMQNLATPANPNGVLIHPFAASAWHWRFEALRNPVVDMVSALSSGYAFARGGVRISLVGPEVQSRSDPSPMRSSLRSIGSIPDEGAELYQFVTLIDAKPTTTDNAPTHWTKNYMALNVLRAQNENIGSDVIVPHVAATPFRLSRIIRPQDQLVSDSWYDSSRYDLQVNRPRINEFFANYDGINVYRAGADDFALGYFIGFGVRFSSLVAT